MKQPSTESNGGEEDALATEWESQVTAVATFVVFLGIMVYVLPPPWITDLEHPDFNPLVLVMGFAGLGLAWQTFKLVRLGLRRKRTGHSRLWVTSGGGVGHLGQVLEGRIQLGRAPAGGVKGPMELTLRCVETHGFRDLGEGSSGQKMASHFVVWEQRATVSPRPLPGDAIDAPFRFELPLQVGTMKNPSQIEKPQRNPYFRFKGAIFLPGFRRVWSTEDSAIGRVWRLEVALPGAGKHYRTEFVVPVQSE